MQTLLDADVASFRAVKVVLSDCGPDANAFVEFVIIPDKEINIIHGADEIDLVKRCSKILNYKLLKMNVDERLDLIKIV